MYIERKNNVLGSICSDAMAKIRKLIIPSKNTLCAYHANCPIIMNIPDLLKMNASGHTALNIIRE